MCFSQCLMACLNMALWLPGKIQDFNKTGLQGFVPAPPSWLAVYNDNQHWHQPSLVHSTTNNSLFSIHTHLRTTSLTNMCVQDSGNGVHVFPLRKKKLPFCSKLKIQFKIQHNTVHSKIQDCFASTSEMTEISNPH